MNIPSSQGTVTALFFVMMAALIFVVIIQPVWCIIDCALAPERSQNSKIIWITVMFFTTYLSSLFYGLFAADSRRLRGATLFSPLAVILAFIGMIYFMQSSPAPKLPAKSSKTAKANKSKANKSKPAKPIAPKKRQPE